MAAREMNLLSVVAPVYNEEGAIETFCDRVAAAVGHLPYELVLVDDGSKDDTAAVLRRLAAERPQLRVIRLARNFGHQAALSAGLDHARGDVTVMLDSDLQDPPELIPAMIDRWRTGSDVVYAVRRDRAGESAFKLATARGFYRLLARIAHVDIPPDAGDFRLLDRRALDALLQMPERNRFLRGMSVWIGFTQTAVPFERAAREAGETKYTLRRMVRLSLDGLVSFSHAPLQLASWFGFLISAVAFLAIPTVVVLRLLGEYIPGFATLTIIVLLLGGIQLITIGIIGEYLGRVYDEVKARPLYVVSDVVDSGGGEGPAAVGAERHGDDSRQREHLRHERTDVELLDQ
jgi:polyisoprenyl-phosphate glycosyltransferase